VVVVVVVEVGDVAVLESSHALVVHAAPAIVTNVNTVGSHRRDGVSRRGRSLSILEVTASGVSMLRRHRCKACAGERASW
jgi:hypothetical protein